MTRLSLLLLTLAAVSAAAGQLLFKIGAKNSVSWHDFINVPIFFGLLLYGVGTVLWIYALSFEKLVNVYAFTGLTFVLVYLGGILILHESISIQAGFGVAAVLGGLFLIVAYS